MSAPLKTLAPRNQQAWRKWLEQNQQLNETVWVICSKKNATKPTISREEAVDEALCYGWIDATTRSLDSERFLQSFTQRKTKSAWCKANKIKVEELIADGRMAEAGLQAIQNAKANGYWSILEEVEALVIPKDLGKEFRKSRVAKTYFAGLSRSNKMRILQWLVMAKRPETRQKRIQEIVSSGEQKQLPKQLNLPSSYGLQQPNKQSS